MSFRRIPLIPNSMKLGQLVCNLKRWGDMRMSPLALTRASTHTHAHAHKHNYSTSVEMDLKYTIASVLEN
jgi:hypothetical protein